MPNFLARLAATARLCTGSYRDLSVQGEATAEGVALVCLSAVAREFALGNLGSFLECSVGIASAVAGWVAWCVTCCALSYALAWGESNVSDRVIRIMRASGFAASPGLLRCFGAFPEIGGLHIFLFASFWMTVAIIVGVSEALTVSHPRAALLCIGAWAIQLVALGSFSHA